MSEYTRTVSRLSTVGFADLLRDLLNGPLTQQREFAFHNIKTAKAAMALLYRWMKHWPDVKARTTIRLDTTTAILTIIPRGLRERRGRQPIS